LQNGVGTNQGDAVFQLRIILLSDLSKSLTENERESFQEVGDDIPGDRNMKE